MNKKSLSERDICTKFITPSIVSSNWDIQKQLREEVYFTPGKILVKGKVVKRGDPKRADYILYHKPNLPIAIIEAKDNNHSLGSGMQQALDYANILDIPFVFSSNGDGYLFHDRTLQSGSIEKEISLSDFPKPEELYEKYKSWKNINEDQEKIITQDYYFDSSSKPPRYYQQVAINRSIEAIAKGQNRLLLVMATGTGKTYTAFQIMWRLWKSGKKKRILFLADRNILLDQAMTNDFKYFGDKMTKVKHHQVDKSYEVYLALYQGVTGNNEEQEIFKQFSRDFFDLIVVDECHRGSANVDSAWREILEYYSSATQIGLTATPMETKDISNISYFEKPIYTYSLKQGIDDGFLAPYKVVRITINKDVEGYRPEIGKVDKYGNEIPDEEYNLKDFDRRLVIDERTETVAKKVSEFLNKTNVYDKTIIYCVDIDHAERMRQALVNQNAELVNDNTKYVMRITGDNEIGKKELDNFIDPESRYPVIVTTSKLLNTGVDVQTCKLIVLDSNIQSMVEFKQIIGRGTRVREDYGKQYFTIMDFRGVTKLFADKDFDGEPVQIYEPKENESPVPPDNSTIDDEISDDTDASSVFVPPNIDIDESQPKANKFYINGVDVKVINERVQYLDKDGKLITESLKDYSKKNILREFASLDDFLNSWNNADKKSAIIEDLANEGILLEELEKEINKDLDPFDLICHIAFDKPPLTRKERANNVRKRNYFTKYGEKANAVLNALLDKYSQEGIQHIENIDILNVKPFVEFGTPYEIVNNVFGGKENYLNAIRQMEKYIYASA